MLSVDVGVGPFVMALKRYGASLKDYPNLAKYDETIRVSHTLTVWLRQDIKSGSLRGLREMTLGLSFQCFSMSVALQTRLDKVLTLSCVGGAIVLHPEEAQALVCCMQARPAFQKTHPPKWKDTPDLEWLSDV